MVTHLFISLNNFQKAEVFNFDQVQFINFSFVDHAFDVSYKCCLFQGHKEFSMFSIFF